MDRDALQEEIKSLHRGRGIRRAAARSWLGPNLRDLMQANPEHSDAELRMALSKLLARHTRVLPDDLRWLFRVAVGMSLDRPLLDQRLAVAEQKLDRRPRVLRRYLRNAEALLAESMLDQSLSDDSPHHDLFASDGWQWAEQDVHLTVRDDAVLVLNRTLDCLTDDQLYMHEIFTVPSGDAELEFKGEKGLRVASVERVTPATWQVGLELPPGLERGASAETSLRITAPNAPMLGTFMVIVPIREIPRLRVTVDFGAESGVRSWRIDGMPTWWEDLAGGAAAATEMPIRSESFLRPRAGLAYGVGWNWPD